MSEKGLLEWLGKRKEDVITVGIRSHAVAVLDTVTELDAAIIAIGKGDNNVAMKCLERLILSEREADRIEDRLCADMSGGELSAQEREDLIHFVRKQDHIANWAKESSIHLQLIIETGASVPDEVWKGIERMSEELIPAVKYLIKALESLSSDVTETIRCIDAVYDQERITDTLYYENIKAAHLSDMDPRALMLVRELILSLEMASDTSKTCADTISILLTSRRK